MNIETLIEEFLQQHIQSEAEVRSKLIVPLLELLEYPKVYRAEEFPVYGYEGSKELPAKAADFLQFSSEEFDTHRGKSDLDLSWVHEHSLLVFEAKKPTETILVKGQPVFYSAWTRSLAYIITNGLNIEGYITNSNYSDTCVFSCSIKDIPQNWEKINQLNYKSILSLKLSSDYGDNWKTNNSFETYKNAWRVKLTSELYASIERSFERIIYEPKIIQGANSLNYNNILNDESKIITSEPGGGKSYLMYMLLRDYMSIYPNNERIPILLEGKYFGKVYHSIEEGIYKELNNTLPFITNDIVNKRLREGGYVILFDALDEIENDYDKLIYELHTLRRDTKNIIIVTTRAQNYKDDLESDFVHYSLEKLSNDDVTNLLNFYSNGKIQFSYHQIPDRLLDIIRTPLFLKLFVITVLQGQPFKIPSNHSKLFEMYIDEKFKNLSCSELEITIIKQVLAQYAIYSYEKGEDSDKFFELLETLSGSLNSKEIYDKIWKTGIVQRGSQGLRFFHKAMHEFLVALHISKLNHQDIQQWLQGCIYNENYYEIICYLTGILSNKEKQNQVLDQLQENNLKLFFKALKSRRNFNIEEQNLDLDYVKKYFNQILNTYKTIIDKHFSNIAQYFDGYDISKDNYTCIKGGMNLDNSHIELVIFSGTKDTLQVDVNISNSQGATLTSPNGIISPIMSSVLHIGQMNIRSYNLELLLYGFDSSREIAVDIIKNQIKEFLDKKVIFDLFDDVLVVERVESLLKKHKFIYKHEDKNETLSLYKHKLSTIIEEISNLNDQWISIKGELLFLIRQLQIKQSIYSDYLDIRGDLNPPQNEGIYWVYDLYSDDCLVSKVTRIIHLTKLAVNNIVYNYLPILKCVYKNTKNIGIVYRGNYGGGVNQIHILSQSDQVEDPIIEFGEEIPYTELDSYFFKKLNDLGKNKNDVVSHSSSAMSLFFNNDVFHDHIYKELKELFNSLFGERL